MREKKNTTSKSKNEKSQTYIYNAESGKTIFACSFHGFTVRMVLLRCCSFFSDVRKVNATFFLQKNTVEMLFRCILCCHSLWLTKHQSLFDRVFAVVVFLVSFFNSMRFNAVLVFDVLLPLLLFSFTFSLHTSKKFFIHSNGECVLFFIFI